MEGPLIDLHQESSVDPIGSSTPSPLSEKLSEPWKFSLPLHTGNIFPIHQSKTGGDYILGGQASNFQENSGMSGKLDSGGTERRWPWSKRDRLKRDPSLDKLDEEVDGLGGQSGGGPNGFNDGKTACPDYFGVRSYLHHFYEWPSYKDRNLYEESWNDDDTSRLLYPAGSRRLRCGCGCGYLCWKLSAVLGVLLLLVGATSVLVGYLVPTREANVGFVTADKQIVDRFATDFNERLDLCKIVGLILFCAGGLILTISLMVPSVFYRCCDEESREAAFSVQSGDVRVPPRKDFIGIAVPGTTKLSEVQPVRRIEEPQIAQKLAHAEAHYGQPGNKR